jgi:formylglycine-generating enzyme required for sulfatase activity
MVIVPEGQFLMGAAPDDPGSNGEPQRQISVDRLAVSRTEVTFNQWAVCVAAGHCPEYPYQDEGMGFGERPVGNITWHDAQTYAAWLSQATGQIYRLLSEAEWEYAARAGSTTLYSWGNSHPVCDRQAPGGAASANCNRDAQGAMEVASFRPNEFGLYDMHGNASEWVQDCYGAYNPQHLDARAVEADTALPPPDSKTEGICTRRSIRGGAIVWADTTLSSAARDSLAPRDRIFSLGFRLARTP